MELRLDDTIAALSSPPGSAARGIIRVTGPEVRRALDSLFQPDDPSAWESATRPRRHSGSLHVARLHAPLPVGLCLWPTARSYTGQPMAELHTLGSPPLLEVVLEDLYSRHVRPARPGEFTLRAFLAGRLDLMQAEAVLGVIDAPDHAELQLALEQLAGGLSGRITTLREDLLGLLADLEAGLDFVEEDIEFIDTGALVARIAQAQAFLEQLLDQASDRMQSRDRLRVVLAGLPNAGKSTLFNALVGREEALVSEVRGTTRDYLSAEFAWDGLSIELIDTAGWEVTLDGIAQQAQSLRNEQFERADLIVWCTASTLAPAERQAEQQLVDSVAAEHPALLRVWTKGDLSAGRPVITESLRNEILLSAPSGKGIPELIAAMSARLTEPHRGDRQLLGMTASRCRESLHSAVAALESTRSAAELGAGEELVAIELREALEHLGRIVGSVYTDDILDRIFSKFCIGK